MSNASKRICMLTTAHVHNVYMVHGTQRVYGARYTCGSWQCCGRQAILLGWNTSRTTYYSPSNGGDIKKSSLKVWNCACWCSSPPSQGSKEGREHASRPGRTAYGGKMQQFERGERRPPNAVRTASWGALLARPPIVRILRKPANTNVYPTPGIFGVSAACKRRR
eukprot:362934-Chlamydomonas_euryale.AAC.2